MRKHIALILTLIVILSLAGCRQRHFESPNEDVDKEVLSEINSLTDELVVSSDFLTDITTIQASVYGNWATLEGTASEELVSAGKASDWNSTLSTYADAVGHACALQLDIITVYQELKTPEAKKILAHYVRYSEIMADCYQAVYDAAVDRDAKAATEALTSAEFKEGLEEVQLFLDAFHDACVSCGLPTE